LGNSEVVAVVRRSPVVEIDMIHGARVALIEREQRALPAETFLDTYSSTPTLSLGPRDIWEWSMEAGDPPPVLYYGRDAVSLSLNGSGSPDMHPPEFCELLVNLPEIKKLRAELDAIFGESKAVYMVNSSKGKYTATGRQRDSAVNRSTSEFRSLYVPESLASTRRSLLIKPALDELLEGLGCCRRVGAFGGDFELAALASGKHHHLHDALAVDDGVLAPDLDRACEGRRGVNERHRRPGVEPEPIHDGCGDDDTVGHGC